jgi:hypothetical protein
MAVVAFSNLGASANPDINDTTDLASYANTSWTPPTADLIGAFVSSRNASGLNTATMSGNGITWTQIATVQYGSGSIHRLTLFGANASGSSAGATTVDFGANTQTYCSVSFFQATSVDLSGGVAAAFVQSPTNSGGAALVGDVTLAAAGNANNRPVSCFSHPANEATTQQTNWTKLDDLAGTVPTRGTMSAYRGDVFDTAAHASWATSAVWGGIAAEIKAAVAGIPNVIYARSIV